MYTRTGGKTWQVGQWKKQSCLGLAHVVKLREFQTLRKQNSKVKEKKKRECSITEEKQHLKTIRLNMSTGGNSVQQIFRKGRMKKRHASHVKLRTQGAGGRGLGGGSF